ncbi:MAG: ribonuclease J [Eubacteriales bacterium]|nr:ribonuclease J [Eubacteriales bacterium]
MKRQEEKQSTKTNTRNGNSNGGTAAKPKQNSKGGMLTQLKKSVKKATESPVREDVKRTTAPTKNRSTSAQASENKSEPLKIIPLGGLNEIGKNLTILEYKNDIMLVDCGFSFPEDEMYGIDIVLPDFTYLIKNANKVKGLILTHGHEDHIGAVPYLLKQLNIPVYGTRLTIGLVENKLKEHGIRGNLKRINPGDKVKIGLFEVETIRVTHSVVDAICLSINTPVGTIFHTGDFKIDYTPVDGAPIDFARLAEIGKRGVKLLMADSTNAMRPGYTASEKVVGEALGNIFRSAEGRIIIATFSSNVHRVQRIIDNAVACGRKVAISGRSMINVVNLAIELGYISIPANTLVDINKLKGIPDSKVLIVTTGSQGEPMSALSRMSTSEHKSVQIRKGDMVILSSTPVPGNEKTVSNVVNKLFEKGADVIYSDIADIHVSGHACQEELKLIHSLIKPTYFMPVHGEYRHLKRHALLAESLGMDSEDIFILENGDMLSLTKQSADLSYNVVSADPVLVDGLGVGDVGNIVLRDRRLLSEAGLIVVVATINRATKEIISGPDIISRGFVYVRENSDLIDEAKIVAQKALEKSHRSNGADWNAMKTCVKEEMRSFIYKSTGRNPVILPIFMEA